MPREDLMYDIPSWAVSLGLLAAMLAAMALGLALGRGRAASDDGPAKDQAIAVQGSLLGLLALLLGFTFSLALARYDDRSRAVVDEANAIGTAMLRSELLPEGRAGVAGQRLLRYAELRARASEVSAANVAGRAALMASAEEVFGTLWATAGEVAREAPNPVNMAYAASLNDMIDALASRDAAIERHVPELVLFLLFATFVLLGAILGFGSGLQGIRPGAPVIGMTVLIVVLVFLIIDLDRPRRGLIEVDQSALRALVPAA